jgi:hypothetical protein
MQHETFAMAHLLCGAAKVYCIVYIAYKPGNAAHLPSAMPPGHAAHPPTFICLPLWIGWAFLTGCAAFHMLVVLCCAQPYCTALYRTVPWLCRYPQAPVGSLRDQPGHAAHLALSHAVRQQRRGTMGRAGVTHGTLLGTGARC